MDLSLRRGEPGDFGAWPRRGARHARSALRSTYEYAVFYGLLAAFGITALAWSATAAALAAVLPRRVGERFGRFMMMAACRGFVGLMTLSGIIECDLKALDALRGRRPLVIAPNHPTLLDVVLILSRLPDVVCTAKAALLGNPLFGGSSRLAGFIRNDAPIHLVRESIRQLRAGRQLLIFPEGTRTTGHGVDAFKSGFAFIAREAGAAVQTVFIDGNSRYLGKGWPLLRKPEFPLVYRIRLGPAVAVHGSLDGFTAALQVLYRREL